MTAHADFASRLLRDRTRALASRGLDRAPDIARLDRLVCIAGARHYALNPAIVTAIQRHACHPVPLATARAARAMLGLAQHGGRLLSVLDLACLLSPSDTAQRPGGGTSALALIVELPGLPPVALRVDAVLGVLALEPGADAQAVILSGASSGLLAALVADPRLHDAIATLDGRASNSPAPGA